MWRIGDPQSNEAAKVKYDIVPYTRGRGLDIGCGPFKAFPHFIGVDNGHHWGTQGADVVSDAVDLSLFASNTLDFVFSSHNLEHIEDTHKALSEWFRVLRDGGYLVLYLPHKDLYPRIGTEGANPDHKHDFGPKDVEKAMEAVGSWDLVVNEVRDHDNGPGESGNEYSFLQVYKKKETARMGKYTHKHTHKIPRPKKTAAVVRYGGFGDMLQASSVLPGLKDQGFHVTMITTPAGHDILKEDPHIDAFIVQDKDQVPNEELGAYWKQIARKYTRFINLSETVEGALLSLPGRISHQWSQAARHYMMDRNYMDVTHAMAEVPSGSRIKFYPTPEEREKALETKRKAGASPLIVWAMSGSSVHKVWPHMDSAIARILVTFPEAKIITVGGEIDAMLETGWEAEERMILQCGKLKIRDTLALAQVADIVIGPETGVLNAVSMEDMAKIVMLSHSSHTNLTKCWKNAFPVIPENTPCYPCHQMHYTFEYCKKDEVTGTAQCQADASLEQFWAMFQNIARAAK